MDRRLTGLVPNFGQEPLADGDWKLFARALSAAVGYE